MEWSGASAPPSPTERRPRESSVRDAHPAGNLTRQNTMVVLLTLLLLTTTHTTQLFPRLLGKTVTYILAVLVSLRMGLGVYAWKTANALEKPSFRTLCTLDGGVELREYLCGAALRTVAPVPRLELS